jgi:hypothetical protein
VQLSSLESRQVRDSLNNSVDMHEPTETTYDLLSSTRYDDALLSMGWNSRLNGGHPSALMLLSYHYDRLVAAAAEHGWLSASAKLTPPALYAACEDAVRNARNTHPDGPFKVRRRR